MHGIWVVAFPIAIVTKAFPFLPTIAKLSQGSLIVWHKEHDFNG